MTVKEVRFMNVKLDIIVTSVFLSNDFNFDIWLH